MGSKSSNVHEIKYLQSFHLQSVMSQQLCGCGQSYGSFGSYAPLNLGNNGLSNLASNVAVSNQGSQVLSSVSSASCGQYGGVGTGSVGVAGDIGVGGNTCVVGSVPVLGSVDFSGIVPASGSVSLSGQCGCGCQ